jgi:hypothetical protein
MELRITIDVFSGRPNPVVELREREAAEALARLRPARKLKQREIPLVSTSSLGYRGLSIELCEGRAPGLPQMFRLVGGALLGPRLAHQAEDQGFEDFVCGSTGLIRKLQMGEAFGVLLRRELHCFRESLKKHRRHPVKWPQPHKCRCAPLYEPHWWNDGGTKQFNNNCYNYATNYRTDTFAQPGLAAGAMYTALTCASVRPAAEKDALISQPGANNKCPGEGHLVALVIAPGWDFHWYRKGRNGLWTHKPGGTPVTNLDNSGVPIPDPRTADRGPYTQFCTFMVVMHGHIKIK